MHLISHTTYKQWAVPWVQYVLHSTQTFLWQILKQNTSIHILKTFLCYHIYDTERYKSRVNDIHKRFKGKTQNYQVSPWKLAFLDAMLHIDENKNIQTTLYIKATDKRAFLLAKS